ncbi:RICIN domain-containing protein [Streptomyces prunicolor]|uniref:RICIN domain-containing protein n=1 Tax=Streptomyces prunicolor TaxID=67348 RepID=UPI00341F287B
MLESPSDESGRGMGRRLAGALTGTMRGNNDAADGGRSSVGGRVLAAAAAVALLAGVSLGAGALLHTGADASPTSQPVAHTTPTASGPTASPTGGQPTGATRHRTNSSQDNTTSDNAATRRLTTVRTTPPADTGTGTDTGAKKGTGTATKSAVTKKKAAVSSTTTKSTAKTYAILSYASRRCISVVGNTARVNASIDIWDCINVPGQRWSFGDNSTVRTLGMCMTATGTAKGSAVTLTKCDGGTNQMFYLNTAHDLVNSSTDMCVDVKDKATHNGTHLQLYSCDGVSNQKWYLA